MSTFADSHTQIFLVGQRVLIHSAVSVCYAVVARLQSVTLFQGRFIWVSRSCLDFKKSYLQIYVLFWLL